MGLKKNLLKRSMSFLLSTALVVGVMPVMSEKAKAEETEYPLWVGGVQVTSENMDDVFGDADEGATVSFTPGSTVAGATLTLNEANITSGFDLGDDMMCGIYASDLDVLNIVLKNDNRIAGDASIGIFSDVDVKISGEGSLTVDSEFISIGTEGDLDIESGTVNCSVADSNGYCLGGESVDIDGGTVTLNGGQWGIRADEVEINGGTVNVSSPRVGIYVMLQISINDGAVTLAGDELAIFCEGGAIVNSIPGKGWLDSEGAGDAAVIECGEYYSEDFEYKKLQYGSSAHVHALTYTEDGATVTVTCADTDGKCTFPEVDGKHAVTLTIAAPTLTVYGQTGEGISASATIIDENGIQGDATIDYYEATKTDGNYVMAEEALGFVPTDAGDYVAEIVIGEEENMAAAFVGYTIEKAEVTAPTIESKAYSGEVQTADVAASTLYTVTTNNGGKNVGNYDVVLTLSDADNYKWTDSNDAAKTLTFTITQANAPAVNVPAPAAVTYDPAKTLADVALADGWAWADATTVPTVGNAGYAAVLTVNDTDYDYSNVEGYDATAHTVTRTVALTVNKAESTPADVTANNRVYDETEQALVNIEGSADGGEMNYAIGVDNTNAPAAGWSKDIPAKEAVGTYYVWYKVVGDANHSDTEPVCVNVTVRANENDKPTDAVVDGNTATVEEITVDDIMDDQTGAVTLDVSTLDPSVTEIEIPNILVANIADAKADSVEIKLPGGTVQFDSDALSAIVEQMGVESLKLNLESVDPGSLNEAQQTAAQEMGALAIVDVTLKTGETTISNFNGGTASVSIPYELEPGEDPNHARFYYVSDDGSLDPMNTYWNDEFATFSTEHFSSYMLTMVPSATVTTAPEAKQLVCDGTALDLVTEGQAEGGEMQYALGTDATTAPSDELYSATVPTATDAGTYYVWYKVVADGFHVDTDADVITVTIEEKKNEIVFSDVTDNKKYYFAPVYWAAELGITKGYEVKDSEERIFGVGRDCTREEMITFLWRAAGKPETTLTESPFSDVALGKYYTKAVLWAAETGITKGYAAGDKAGTFGVGETVTREDTVTFLYRMAGKPEVTSTDISFSDVEAGKYYTKAIIWAADNGITKGYATGDKAGTFGVGENCLREQIITFLYRFDKTLNRVHP